MKILALEFSSPRRSVAVLDGERVLAEQCDGARPPARDLSESPAAATPAGGDDSRVPANETVSPLRLVDRALQAANLERTQIECIAVGLGPGSYSGIRGAIALAQGWQVAAGVKLTGVSSSECIAAQAQEEGVVGVANVIIDAQRGELYSETFEMSKKFLKSAKELTIITLTEAKSKMESESVLIGPEITRWFAGGRVIFPTAAALGRLAARATRFVSGDQLEPIYLRETSFVKAPAPRILPSL